LANEKIRVHFDPDLVEIVVAQAANLLEVAITAGVQINASCGGAGVCGTCKVIIEKGEVTGSRTEKLSETEYEQGFRLACQSGVVTDLTVHIPVESRLEKIAPARESGEPAAGGQQPEVLATGWEFDPPLNKLFIELSPPTLDDNVSDLSRLLRGLKQQYHLENIAVDFGVVRKLAEVLRAGDWRVTVTTLLDGNVVQSGGERKQAIINIEPGDTSGWHYSLVFDLGTTTVHGQLLDLNRGEVLALSIDYNRQISCGEDVITRIAYCRRPGGLEKLQQLVVAAINGIIEQLLVQAGVERKHVGYVVVAGNTTMLQLLLGLEPKYIRLAPYTPVANLIPQVKANELGLELGAHVYLHTLPSVASYVGADIVSGILGTGVYQSEKLTLFMDIGTNGEIVVGNADWLVTAACSAGPALEGGGIKHGMIATNGAIEGFDLDPSSFEPALDIVGGARPKGICGSGLINTVAELLTAGVINQNGKFNTDLPTKRVRRGDDGGEYVLCWASETQIGKDIVLTEVDIDNLIRAKAAMYAGGRTLLQSVALSYSDLERVIIAGTFGSNINIEKAITIGLLPDLPRDKFIFTGNSSLLGARLTSFSTGMLNEGERVARMMTNLELSESAAFMENYVAALFLPHTNAVEFPSVESPFQEVIK
jgi:uncharacterized 2Fe-2S/4Fe-4S cluster protein (DUF4445 family)